MSNQVFVTGIGMISSIGLNAQEALESIRAGRSGIGEPINLSTRYRGDIPVYEVRQTNDALKEIAGVSKGARRSRTALLGMIAAMEAIRSANIDEISDIPTGLISATTVGGMDRSELFYADFLSDNEKGDLRDIITHDCGDSTEKIAEHLGIRDFITTISTACSSSANAIMLGARLIKSGHMQRVIAGGTDALTKFTLNGFNSLMILDRDGCRPFDNNRRGLSLGEGAGFVVLESERAVKNSGKEALCELKGYGNACDAYHQTASSPDGNGAFLAMNKALKTSGLSAGDIDYINAHGTGTENNDLSEGVAIERLFSPKIPSVSSTKSFTGHTLGAAGGIEAVLSALAIKHDIIPHGLRFSERMKELNFTPVTKLIENAGVNNVLSNSFGFGGNNTTLIFSREA